MKGFGTFGLSLAELAINILSAVFVILVGSVALASRSPCPVPPPPPPPLPTNPSYQELLADNRRFKDDLGQARESIKEKDALLKKYVSSIPPTCSGGPLFRAVIRPGGVEIGHALLSVREIRQRYSRQLQAAAHAVPRCVYSISFSYDETVDKDELTKTYNELAETFRVPRLHAEK